MSYIKPQLAILFAFSLVAAAADGLAADHLRQLQQRAEESGVAPWGHWGSRPKKYASWSNHSNRLIPVYTFGVSLDAFQGKNSIYRDAARLQKLYGKLPEQTLNSTAEYFDQTEIYSLQKRAAEAGKKYIFLIIFDGLDWTITQAAATCCNRRVAYTEGRGTGFYFQDYRGAPTDYGFCVSSPYCSEAQCEVDWQTVLSPGERRGGYDPQLGGRSPWESVVDLGYLIGSNRQRPHAVTDSASSATALCSGIKTYNDAINVDAQGRQVEPIARLLQAQGYAVGAVSSVPISHATVACAYANNVSREDYQDLARDQLGVVSVAHKHQPLPGLDVLIGAGWGVTAQQWPGQGQNYIPGNPYLDSATLKSVDVARGGRYRLVRRTAGVNGSALLARAAQDAASNGQRLLGLFGTHEGNLPFQTTNGKYDPYVCPMPPQAESASAKFNPQQPYAPAEVFENPTLADFTRAALEVLEKRDRFWLMVEAGDLDWAMHANNLDNAIGALKSGDDAFRAVVSWIEERNAWSDSAVILTGDHGHLLVLTQPEALIPASAGLKASATQRPQGNRLP